MKGRSIQDNLHLVCQILERIEDDTEAALINLDQSKAFDRADHRFLAAVQVNGRRSRAFAIDRSDKAAPCLLFYVLSLEPLLRRLRDERTRPALRGIKLTGSIRAKISAFADDISFCVPPSGHSSSEYGGREVRKGSKCQGHL